MGEVSSLPRRCYHFWKEYGRDDRKPTGSIRTDQKKQLKVESIKMSAVPEKSGVSRSRGIKRRNTAVPKENRVHARHRHAGLFEGGSLFLGKLFLL